MADRMEDKCSVRYSMALDCLSIKSRVFLNTEMMERKQNSVFALMLSIINRAEEEPYMETCRPCNREAARRFAEHEKLSADDFSILAEISENKTTGQYCQMNTVLSILNP